jgi:hypothetical protein
MVESSVTDWVQAIGVIIALPISVAAVIKLFLKDKERDIQIKSLNKMAEEQHLSTENLIEQLEETRKQTLLMAENNEILRVQNEFQNSLLIRQEFTNQQKLELNKLKRRNEIKPNFIQEGNSRQGCNYQIHIKNIGKLAKKIFIKYSNLINIDFSPMNSEMDILDNTRPFALKANIGNPEIGFSYEIEISYFDEEDNKYIQVIIKNNRENKISLPEYQTA